MHHTLIIKALIVWTHLYTCIQGNRFNTSNGSLIFIDGYPVHYDIIVVEDTLLVERRDSNVANEYFKYCDEIELVDSHESKYESISVYSSSSSVCCTTTLCLCDSIKDALHHIQNNTVIVMASSVFPWVHLYHVHMYR